MTSDFLHERFKFLKNFLINWKATGSIAPSSRFLAIKMLKSIDFDKARLIVELGMGTGSITKYILKNMNKDCVLLAFDTNKEFCDFVNVSIKDHRLKIVNDSVLNLKKYLDNNNVDCVISGIPLACFNKEDKKQLLTDVRDLLKKDGEYTQFQYSLESYKELKKVFNTVKLSFTLLSIPPAFVYRCKK